jgi:hypothetical protein
MSFARKIKTLGSATFATFATHDENKHEENPSVATLAKVARGPTLESEQPTEVVPVHSPRLRRLFEARGLSPEEALELAARLYLRTAEWDDRKVCFECQHYSRKHCSNAKMAGLSNRFSHTQLPVDMSTTPQRCGGFAVAQFE